MGSISSYPFLEACVQICPCIEAGIRRIPDCPALQAVLGQHLLKAFFHKLAFPFIMLPCYSLSGMPQRYKTTIRLVLV